MSACTPCFSSTRRVSSGYSVETRAPTGRSSIDRTGESLATASTTRMGLAVVFEYASSPSDDDLGAGLLDPVTAGDPEVEEALGHVPGDLLGPQDADLVHAGVVDAGPVVDVGAPHHAEVGGGEQLQRRLFQRALGQDQSQHRFSEVAQRAGDGADPGNRRSRSAISSAVTAAS